jgi:DNA polymerase-1
MIVDISNWRTVLEKLYGYSEYAIDTETTGLEVYGDDELFSIIIAHKDGAFYFNFNDFHDIPRSAVLAKTLLQSDCFRKLWEQECTWYMHNAKFDLGMLAKNKVHLKGDIHCTMAIARVEYNEHLDYSLAKCAERIKEEKLDIVEEYIKKNKLYEWQDLPGKKKRMKRKFFERVPWDIITDYGLRDAKITLKLGCIQTQAIDAIDRIKVKNQSSLWNIVNNEKALTKVCFAMEQRGIKIDTGYCHEAARYEQMRYEAAAAKFKELTGIDFVDSNKCLQKAFDADGVEYARTDKGNPSFIDPVLARIDSPVSHVVQEYRDAYKRANTYFRNMTYFADDNDVIHADVKQSGTATGRFSYANPNLQNIHKEEKGQYTVRRAFVPRDGYLFVMIDYDQMEFRLMLDYAGQTDLINKIIDGHDPHQATADLVGIPRKEAKTLNFGLLYGMGANALSRALGVSETEAVRFKEQYFDALPRVKKLIKTCQNRAKNRGFLFNWAGRRYVFKDPRFAYKGANYLIQGGCSDIVKMSMVKLHQFLLEKKSKMLIQIHDEILYEIHESELDIIPQLQHTMENTYQPKLLPMTCSVSHSYKNWGDVIDGMPVGFSNGAETRDRVQEQNSGTTEGDARHVVC